jgi:hypothetical protein
VNRAERTDDLDRPRASADGTDGSADRHMLHPLATGDRTGPPRDRAAAGAATAGRRDEARPLLRGERLLVLLLAGVCLIGILVAGGAVPWW